MNCNAKFSVIEVQNYAGSVLFFMQSLIDNHQEELLLHG